MNAEDSFIILHTGYSDIMWPIGSKSLTKNNYQLVCNSEVAETVGLETQHTLGVSRTEFGNLLRYTVLHFSRLALNANLSFSLQMSNFFSTTTQWPMTSWEQTDISPGRTSALLIGRSEPTETTRLVIGTGVTWQCKNEEMWKFARHC